MKIGGEPQKREHQKIKKERDVNKRAKRGKKPNEFIFNSLRLRHLLLLLHQRSLLLLLLLLFRLFCFIFFVELSSLCFSFASSSSSSFFSSSAPSTSTRPSFPLTLRTSFASFPPSFSSFPPSFPFPLSLHSPHPSSHHAVLLPPPPTARCEASRTLAFLSASCLYSLCEYRAFHWPPLAAEADLEMGWQSSGHSNYPGFDTFAENQKDYYKVLEVDYDATEESIRTNYLRLALKWHPDKHKGEDFATAKFQEINEAYKVLSDPAKRLEYDVRGDYDVQHYSIIEYLDRFKGLILTCNGLGIGNVPMWTTQSVQVGYDQQ